MSSHKLFKKSFNSGKCKTSLKLAMSRMKLLSIKRQEQLKVMKRNLAQILQSGQEQTARARVEHVYREENTIAAYDLLESFGEQIIVRLQMIESQKKCPLDLEEPISSILFASQRCAEIQEFTDIRHHFSSKYGKEFVSAAVELRAGCRVNRTVIEKLSAKTPDGQTKLKMLAAIAKEHNVDWVPDVVEEQVSNLPEAKLAGPTEFITATKITEFPDVPKHNPGTKVVDHGTNIRSPEDPTSQVNSKKPSAPGPGTSNANIAPDYQPRAPENVAADASVDIKYKHEGLLLEKSHWHMHFKDATAAAKAAAKSAERASIAARAAAELSSLEKMSRQNSIESRESERGNIPVELPHSQLNKTLQEGLANKNECPPEGFHATDATFQGEVKDNSEEMPGRGYDHRNLKATRSKSGSSRSTFSSHEDELLASGAQWTESPCPSSPQQKETVNFKWRNHENVRGDLSEDGSVKKRMSPSHLRDTTYHDSESFGVPMVADMQRTEGHSPRSPPESETLIMKRLPSESVKFGSHGEASISERTFSGSKTEVDTVIFSTASHHFSLSSTSGEGIFLEGDTAKTVPTYDSGAVFDNSGSESESCLDLEDAVVDSKLDNLVPVARRSSDAVPSTVHPRKSREPGNESLKRDGYTIPSRSTSEVYRSSSSDRNVMNTTEPSPYYDPVVSTFDDSDGLDSSSEEEANGRAPPILRNVSSSRESPPSPRIKHGPVEFASYSGNEVREHKKKQPPVLHDSDSDDSFDGNTVSVSAAAGKSPVRLSISTVKDQKRTNSLEPRSKRVGDLDNVTTATFYTDTGGPEPLVDSDTDSSNVLKFDRLGGLRNKGYIRPPYIRDPSRISSSNVNNLTSEERSLSNTPEASHRGKIPLSLRENQESSKLKGSSELQKKKPKSSGHYFDDTVSDSDEAVDPGVSIIQGVGRGIRTTLSSDFQEQHRFSGRKSEILASVESGVSVKSRSPKKTPILRDEVLTELVEQDGRGSGHMNVIPAASVRTAGRSTRSSQLTTNRNPKFIDELDTTSSLDSSFSEESRRGRPVRGTHVEERPRPISTTQKMETKAPRRSYDYIDSDSDEPIDTGSLLHQNLVNRRSKASTSNVTPAQESPPQATQLGGPEIFKVDRPSSRSLPVSHVEGQPKHTSSTTVASGSSKDVKQYGSDVANKGVKSSAPRRTLLENKELKTSRTSYHGYGSDSDESTETTAYVGIKMVNKNSKDDSLQRIALQDNPPYQPSGGGPKFRAKIEVPDSKVWSTRLQNQPPETLPESQKQTKTAASDSSKADVKPSQKQTKTAASDTSRADVKPSGSSVPATSRENSFQRASHVHPKLPDYDSLVERLQAARREK